MRGAVTAHMLSFVNRRHVTAEKIDAAMRDIIDCYHQFALPRAWGDGKSAAADGTQYRLYEQNLVADYHIRYGSFGAIAYHHVSDNYIALFSHFIPPGVWEAIYIIEGLLKNTSVIQPGRIHADTKANQLRLCIFVSARDSADAKNPKLEGPRLLPFRQECILPAHRLAVQRDRGLEVDCGTMARPDAGGHLDRDGTHFLRGAASQAG
jgi:hypothetical protein